MHGLNHAKALLAIFFTANLLAGCVPASFAKTPPTIPLESLGQATPYTDGKWTIIQYHDADNDLGIYAYADLQEMMAVGSNGGVNIVVLYDTYAGPAASYYITNGGAYKISDYGEVDMGDPDVLAAFILEAMTNYPAEHCLLNIWDHGDDFLGSCRDYHTGPGQEEGEHGFLYHTELLSAIGSNHFDILAFDACIESMVEVAYDYRTKADYLVASEDYVPYWGFPYDAILSDLETNPTADAGWVSSMIVNDYMEEYLKPNGNGGGGYVMAFPTLSAVDLSQTDSFVDELNIVAAHLTSDIKTYKGAISSVRGKSMLNMPIYGWDADIDLYTFIDEISSRTQDEEMKTAAENIKTYWTGTTPFIYARYSDQYAAKSAHGMGIYFPASRGSLIHNTITDAEYYFGGKVPFSSDTNWGEFLRTYFDYWL
jgi:hypothetical protein